MSTSPPPDTQSDISPAQSDNSLSTPLSNGQTGGQFDWIAIRDEYVQSDSVNVRHLALKHGCPVYGLQRRAHREKWPLLRAQRMAAPLAKQIDKALLTRATNAAVAEATRLAAEWTSKSLNVAGRIVQRVDRLVDIVPNGPSLSSLSNALDTADKVGRRALGLDKEAADESNARPVVNVQNLNVSGNLQLGMANAKPSEHGPVIEVESTPDSSSI